MIAAILFGGAMGLCLGVAHQSGERRAAGKPWGLLYYGALVAAVALMVFFR